MTAISSVAAPTLVPAGGSKPGRARAKVLLVDDLSANLYATSQIFKSLDIDVVEADSGPEALRQILRGDFAVVLLDVQMPGMDGFEVASLIRANPATSELPIIFLTAISKEDKFVFRGYDRGAVDYLFKPLEPQVLLAKVRIFVELWRQRHELQQAHERLLEETAQRQAAQAQLRAAQRLEALGRLVAGVGHEINNPLTYVIANLEAAKATISDQQSDAPTKNDGELLDMLAEARQGAEHIKSIVRDLKRFSRLTPSLESAASVLQTTEAAVRMLANQIQPRARIETKIDHLPMVRIDPGQLTQVLVNLLTNALDALPDPGGAGAIEIAARRQADRVLIEIKDSGCGMAPDVLERALDPFFTTKGPDRGTGLGLSVCHEIVVTAGGNLQLESAVGHGTTVRITLPVAELPPPVRVVSSDTDAPAAGPRLRLLIVDDDEMVLRSLKRHLSAHDIQLARSGAEGVALCRKQTFDVVLCDVVMPGMSGLMVRSEIAKLDEALGRRVVFMTGGAFISGAQEMLAKLPNQLIEKPVDTAVLEKVLKSVAAKPND